MIWQHVLGAILATLMTLAFFGLMIRDVGWREALALVGIMAGICGGVALVVYLLTV